MVVGGRAGEADARLKVGRKVSSDRYVNYPDCSDSFMMYIYVKPYQIMYSKFQFIAWHLHLNESILK